MKKEDNLEGRDPLVEMKNNFWHALNLLRGFIDANEFHFVLFLLTLQRKGVLKEIVYNDQDNLKYQIEQSIQKLDEDTAEDLSAILRLYEQTFRRVNVNVLYELISFFRSLDKEVLEQHFAEIFEDLFYQLAKWQGRFGSEFYLPIQLSRFVCALAELPKQALVYNPFGGVATFGICLQESQGYVGQELNFTAWAIGYMRLSAHNRTKNAKWLLGNSIVNWNPVRNYQSNRLEDILIQGSVKEVYDLIIANPPYGARLQNRVFGKYGPIKSYEHYFIENALNELKPNGKVIALISQSFLFHTGTDRILKKHIVDNDLLDMVISFPGGLLTSTGIPVSILVLNKRKEKKGVVRFIDAKSFVKTTSSREKVLKDNELFYYIKSTVDSDFIKNVSNETISQFDFNLSVPRYFQKKYEGFPLKDLGTFIRGQRINKGLKGKYIRIRDLKDDVLESQLNIDIIEDTEIPRQAQKISESCLLLASRWKTLKPTYFNYTGTPIFIMPDVLAFKIDESKCDLYFLINELQAGYVTEQLDALRMGSVIPIIRKEDLLAIVISVPGLDEQGISRQRSLVKQRLVELGEEKKKELILFNKIHGLENEIVEQNTYLRHTLAGPSSNLKDSISNIKRIIMENVIPVYPHLLDLKLSDKHMVSLGEYLSIIERDSDRIVSAVTSQLKVDTGIESKKLVPVEIIDFLYKYTFEYNERVGLNFSVEFELDKEVFTDSEGNQIKAFILANDELLRDLFDNLIDNAVKHAFSKEGKNRIEIFLMKNTENEDQDEVQILFSNTGTPFPEDFTINDFIRKGSKFGLKAGDGFGGWYISEIIKKLNGEFDIIDETGSEGLPGTDLATSFEINFPIIDTEEHV